jgi:hypothetical protein
MWIEFYRPDRDIIQIDNWHFNYFLYVLINCHFSFLWIIYKKMKMKIDKSLKNNHLLYILITLFIFSSLIEFNKSTCSLILSKAKSTMKYTLTFVKRENWSHRSCELYRSNKVSSKQRKLQIWSSPTHQHFIK